MDRSGCSKCITIDHSRYTAFYNVVFILVQFVVFGLLSTIFLYYVYLVAQVSSKNFAKVLLLFQIPKDTVFSCAGAPLSNVRVAFLKTLQYQSQNSVSCRVIKLSYM